MMSGAIPDPGHGSVDMPPTPMPSDMAKAFDMCQAMYFAESGRAFSEAIAPIKKAVMEIVVENIRLQKFIRSHRLDPGFGPKAAPTTKPPKPPDQPLKNSRRRRKADKQP